MRTYFGAPNVRNLGWVPRWTIMKRHHTQSVAEHSFFVALYAFDVALIVDLNPQMYPSLLHYALTHDMEEMITGDLPGPYKHALPDPAPGWVSVVWDRLEVPVTMGNPDIIRQIVKVADLIDSFLYLEEEIMMGNQIAGDHIVPIQGQLIQAADALREPMLNVTINRLVLRSRDRAKPQVI